MSSVVCPYSQVEHSIISADSEENVSKLEAFAENLPENAIFAIDCEAQFRFIQGKFISKRLATVQFAPIQLQPKFRVDSGFIIEFPATLKIIDLLTKIFTNATLYFFDFTLDLSLLEEEGIQFQNSIIYDAQTAVPIPPEMHNNIIGHRSVKSLARFINNARVDNIRFIKNKMESLKNVQPFALDDFLNYLKFTGIELPYKEKTINMTYSAGDIYLTALAALVANQDTKNANLLKSNSKKKLDQYYQLKEQFPTIDNVSMKWRTLAFKERDIRQAIDEKIIYNTTEEGIDKLIHQWEIRYLAEELWPLISSKGRKQVIDNDQLELLNEQQESIEKYLLSPSVLPFFVEICIKNGLIESTPYILEMVAKSKRKKFMAKVATYTVCALSTALFAVCVYKARIHFSK